MTDCPVFIWAVMCMYRQFTWWLKRPPPSHTHTHNSQPHYIQYLSSSPLKNLIYADTNILSVLFSWRDPWLLRADEEPGVTPAAHTSTQSVERQSVLQSNPLNGWAEMIISPPHTHTPLQLVFSLAPRMANWPPVLLKPSAVIRAISSEIFVRLQMKTGHLTSHSVAFLAVAIMTHAQPKIATFEWMKINTYIYIYILEKEVWNVICVIWIVDNELHYGILKILNTGDVR